MMKKTIRQLIFIWIASLMLTSVAFGEGRLKVDIPQDRAALVYDVKSDEIMYSQNSHVRMYPASTTKLMTVLVAMDYVDLDEKVVPGREVLFISADSSRADLASGSEISTRDLLAATLLPSGNDAANALAVHVGRIATGDENLDAQRALEDFLELMNKKAEKLGLEGSNFVNPHGLHHDQHYTTAYDLLKITMKFLENDYLASLVSKAHYRSEDGTYEFYNTNVFLHERLEDIWYLYSSGINPNYSPYVTGVKTGFTSMAGRCLVFSAAKDDKELVGIVLGSDLNNLYREGLLLMDSVFEETDYIDTFDEGETVAVIEVKTGYFGKTQTSTLVNEEKVYYLLPKESLSDVTFEIYVDENKLKEVDGIYHVQTMIDPGDKIGTVSTIYDGETLYETPIYASEGFKEIKILPLILSIAAVAFLMLLIAAVIVRRMEKR